MSTAQEHYEQLLAGVYVWMAGGIEAALAAGAQDVAEFVPGKGHAVDLGAGFGMHAIPLARAGWDVLALDTSAELLAVLQAQSAALPVRAVQANLLEFRAHTHQPAELIVCLGDTLTHLPAEADVQRLAQEVARSLAPGGTFVLTFRDYTQPASGLARFIPVRSDAGRIHTCFLEEQPDHMRVHDLIHEREGEGWRMRISSYPKLRLAPEAVAGTLREVGLRPTLGPGPRGMVRIVATR